MNILELKVVYEEDIEKIKSVVKIKEYLPFIEKHVMVENLIKSCVSQHGNGLKYVDPIQKHFTLELMLVSNYTDIEFDEDEIVDEYDWLKSSGIMGFILLSIPKSEIDTIKMYLEEKIQSDIALYNTVEGIIANGVSEVMGRLPSSKKIGTWLNDIKKKFEKIDPEQYKNVSEIFNYVSGKNKDEDVDKNTIETEAQK
jgi:hypothetical protein